MSGLKSHSYGLMYIVLFLCLFTLPAGTVTGNEAMAEKTGRVSMPGQPTDKAPLDQLPLYFIKNQGQHHEEVAYYVKGVDSSVYFTSTGVTFALSESKADGTENTETSRKRWSVKLDFIGADPSVEPEGEDKQDAIFNYFKGEPKDWNSNVSTFGKVVYKDLWPGIDLVYSGQGQSLKYDFVVKPHADPDQIRLTYRGAEDVSLLESGAMRITTPIQSFEDGKPYAFQEIDGKRSEVSMAYAVEEQSAEGAFTYGFDLGEYDRSRTLVLDPVFMAYCGYIGGLDWDMAASVAMDLQNQVFVTGFTKSTEIEGFPLAIGPYMVHGGLRDVFVAKVASTGMSLAYCGYIGGSQDDFALGIAVDNSGEVYVTGHTRSTVSDGFPVTVGPDLTHNGDRDAFVAKVNASGTGLVYCGYIGGPDWDMAEGIAVSSMGHAFVTGYTRCDETTFPVSGGPDLTHNGTFDAFVAKVKVSGNGLVYCGYIGGTDADSGKDIALDNAGNAYVTGTTWSSVADNFPVLVGPDLTENGVVDGFVAKVNAGGTALEYCGYIGGSQTDYAWAIDVDNAGRAYVTGQTWSSETDGFPVVVGPDLTYNGSSDAFLARVSPSGSYLQYCGYIGGSSSDGCNGVGVDQWGRAYVVGTTGSPDLPVSGGPFLTYNDNVDVFLASIKISGLGLYDCGYLGGTSWEHAHDIAVSPWAAVAICGQTYSTEAEAFPVLTGPDLTHSGGMVGEAFVAYMRYLNPISVPIAVPVPVPLPVPASSLGGAIPWP